MVKVYLHKILPKPKHIRCGNWERIPLSDDQKKYAELDAYVSYYCYRAMFEKCYITLEDSLENINIPNNDHIVTGTTNLEKEVSFMELDIQARIKYIFKVLNENLIISKNKIIPSSHVTEDISQNTSNLTLSSKLLISNTLINNIHIENTIYTNEVLKTPSRGISNTIDLTLSEFDRSGSFLENSIDNIIIEKLSNNDNDTINYSNICKVLINS
jgi:hypothetical protein